MKKIYRGITFNVTAWYDKPANTFRSEYSISNFDFIASKVSQKPYDSEPQALEAAYRAACLHIDKVMASGS